jgi:hypothetical protein
MDRGDADLAVFAEVSVEVQQEYAGATADPWKASPFAWIKGRASRQRGAIGERLVKAWAKRSGFSVTPASDTGHDCRLDGVPVEVKFSTLWETGHFVFQQIRDQSYDVVALLGLAPQSVHLWMVPKAELWERAPGQHTGAAGVDTKWLRFPADDPPSWLQRYGGPLIEAQRALEEARDALRR